MPRMTRRATSIDWQDVKRRIARSQESLDITFAEESSARREMVRLRTMQLAERRRAEGPKVASRQVLVCRLGGERYGLDAALIIEVSRLGKFTMVPGASPELFGVVNVRGEIHIVLCLRRLLGLPNADESPEAGGYIALMRSGSARAALLVDSMDAIKTVSLPGMTPVTSSEDSPASAYVEGVTEDGVILLNSREILAHPLLTDV